MKVEHKCWTWPTTFAQSLREPQSEQAKAQQMEATERQVHMGIQTDGHMKSSTCFWHRTSTLAAGFRVEKITGEFYLTGLLCIYKPMDDEFLSMLCIGGVCQPQGLHKCTLVI